MRLPPTVLPKRITLSQRELQMLHLARVQLKSLESFSLQMGRQCGAEAQRKAPPLRRRALAHVAHLRRYRHRSTGLNRGAGTWRAMAEP